MIFQKIVKYFINLVFFITDGKVNKFTIDDIAFSCVEKGSYFGEIEIFKKTHRENCTKTIENCHFLTMKRELLTAENIIKFQDFFKNKPGFFNFVYIFSFFLNRPRSDNF